MDKLKIDSSVVCVMGLGHVGIPLVEAFSKKLRVIGFDKNKEKLKELAANNNLGIEFTHNSQEINKADFIIICVPTPITRSKDPDLSFVKEAAMTAGKNLKKGSMVILESTVYPGVTEEVVKPILEGESKLVCGADFKIAYSPERINPGDKEHTIDKVTKIVAGMDKETTELVAELYETITPHIFRVNNIKTAESAKVIENIQRDLNIALVNELALIFEKMGLNTKDILDAAATKWNFHRYFPGLVGGHCIPVDPYYLVYKAREMGYHPQVILAGRAINDSMPSHVVDLTVRALSYVGKLIKDSNVLILGLTYKENVADTRETPVKGIIKGLQEYGVDIFGYDPLLDDITKEFGIKISGILEKSHKHDAVIIAVPHEQFRSITLTELKESMSDYPILIDVQQFFNPAKAEHEGFYYRTL